MPTTSPPQTAHTPGGARNPPNFVLAFVIVALYNALLWSVFAPSKPQQSDAQGAVARAAAAASTTSAKPTNAKCLAAKSENMKRRRRIVRMTKSAWSAFYDAAGGYDELLPLTDNGTNSWGDIGITAVDSLDTLYFMGLKTEYEQAKKLALQVNLSDAETSMSVFETIIRHLGGYLAMYAATGEGEFLALARHVGDAFVPAYLDAPNQLPPGNYYAYGGKELNLDPASEGKQIKKVVLAEVGSTQLEMRYLSLVTRTRIYGTLSNRFVDILRSHRRNGWPTNDSLYVEKSPRMPHPGLWGTFMEPETLKISGSSGWHAMMDSTYEYFLKQWILFGKADDELLEMYEDSVEALMRHLVKYGRTEHTAVLGYVSFEYIPGMDHLVCFAPGTLILGVMHGAHSWPGRRRNWSAKDVEDIAEDLLATCFRQYRESITGIGPESVRFDANGSFTATNPSYKLRPETIESIFYFYRYTHDEKYRNWGWEIAQAINWYCKVPETGAFASLKDVTRLLNTTGVDGQPELTSLQANNMESFFFAETLKYLYLLFSDDDVVPLDRFVFTTEAHALPIRADSEAKRQKKKSRWSMPKKPRA